MDLDGSVNLKEIPDLSMATNLETLELGNCKSLVELPSFIRNLNKLLKLNMEFCNNLKTLPTGFNLKSLGLLNFNYCSELRTFPEISTNISDLYLTGTNIEELPSNLHLENLVELSISKEESDGRQWEGVKVCSSKLKVTTTFGVLSRYHVFFSIYNTRSGYSTKLKPF